MSDVVLTSKQADLARHALGLGNGRKRSYRNYFVTDVDGRDGREWMALVNAGLAKTRAGNQITGGDNVFWLMLDTATAALLPGETLDKEYFQAALGGDLPARADGESEGSGE